MGKWRAALRERAGVARKAAAVRHGLAPAGQGLATLGQGLAPLGQGLAPLGQGFAAAGQLPPLRRLLRTGLGDGVACARERVITVDECVAEARENIA